MKTQEIMAVPLLNEEFGNPISEKLSNLLRSHITKDDRANVSTTTGIGSSTVRNIVFRSTTLTEDNSKAAIELVNVAIKNCETTIANANKAKHELKLILKSN